MLCDFGVIQHSSWGCFGALAALTRTKKTGPLVPCFNVQQSMDSIHLLADIMPALQPSSLLQPPY
jgi:hypothetical protein